MRYVFDVDDTISRCDFRDYENAEPITEITNAITEIKRNDQNAYICLHSSRGMLSCDGDIQKIESTHRERLVSWLQKHEIPYDELIFGKPYADVYVDDKAVNVLDIQMYGCCDYRGYSGAEIKRVGSIVIKRATNVAQQRDWYLQAENLGFSDVVPKVLSCNNEKIYIEYIPGVTLSNCDNISDKTPDVISLLERFKRATEKRENKIDEYYQYVQKRAKICDIQFDQKLDGTSEQILSRRTFAHGDFSLSNIIIANDGALRVFDPSYKLFFSHYLLDASKFRVSLCGLDNILSGATKNRDGAILRFDSYFNTEEREIIKWLQKTHVIRVLYYAIQNNDKKREAKLRRLFNELN